MATEQNLWSSFHGGIKDGEFSSVTDKKTRGILNGTVT